MRLLSAARGPLSRPVQVGKVRFNPYTLALTLENFTIGKRDGKSEWLGWQRLYVNFGLTRSLFGAWTLDAVELDGFRVDVVMQADGALNFSDLIAKFAPQESAPKTNSAAARPVRVISLKVNEAKIDFDDLTRAQPFHSTVGPLTFSLRDFHTAAGSDDAPYHFAAVTESGEQLTWTGTLAAVPFHSRGELKLENILLPKYAPYYAGFSRADLLRGTMSLRARYSINLDEKAEVLRLDDGELHLSDIVVAARGQTEPLIELPSFDATGLSADALTMQANMARVAVQGAKLQVERAADGSINLLGLLPPASPKETTPGTAASAPKARPALTVGEVAADGVAINITDHTTPSPAHLAVHDLKAQLENFSLADGAVMPVQVQLAWAPAGTIALDGTVTLLPSMQAELNLKMDDFAMLPLSPYLEQQLNARLTSGSITLNGKATAKISETLEADFTGDTAVASFGLVDAAHSEPLAGWQNLAVSGIHAALSPQLKLRVDTVTVDQPYADVVVHADRSINLLGLAKAAPETVPAAQAETAAPAETPAPSLPDITVATVQINGGAFRFTDHGMAPEVHMAINQFGGKLAGLSSANPGQGEVELAALVDGAGPVSIKGKLDVLSPRKFADLKVDFKNVDLLPLGPYSQRYAGYDLARGKLQLDVKAQLQDRALNAENVITLHQFTFGAASNSPEATKLPVRLGVALLKDTDGQIVIDVPVNGNLDDPQFRVGRVVMRVIVNLLTKAAVSPFSLLGSMFGGGEELGWQEFDPGQGALRETAREKLETMVKALTNRPALSLGIEGGYDAAADTHALQFVKVDDLVRRKIWEARHATNPNIPPPEQIEISADDSAAMLHELFDAQFPPGSEYGTPLPPPLVLQPLPEPPHGFFKRLVDSITGKTRRERRAVEAENAQRKADYEKAVAEAQSEAATPAAMRAHLAGTMTVSEGDLAELAAQRARTVRDYLVAQGISADRIFMTKDAPKTDKGPRVQLSLQ